VRKSTYKLSPPSRFKASEVNGYPDGSQVRIVSLFSGAGGLEIAACQTGLVAAVVSTDSNATFLSTVEKNMPAHFKRVRHAAIVADARELQGETMRALIGGAPDVVMGGPPCDDYTQFGKRRGIAGEKGPLIFEFLRVVAETRPTCFVFENVPNLARQFKDVFQSFLKRVQDIGYSYKWAILKACDYGSPTIRSRVFVVGWRRSQDNRDFEFPLPKFGDPQEPSLLLHTESILKPYVYVRDVLTDVPDIHEASSSLFLNHTGRPHRAETVEHMKSGPQGKKVSKSFRYRAPWDGLCMSLTAGVDYATKSYLHPNHHREMSVREYARIHSFPDTWKFEGTHHNGVKQVANSVPIPLGKAVLASVFHKILGKAMPPAKR